jgi:transcriptional regulator with XRE-family HTH domain
MNKDQIRELRKDLGLTQKQMGGVLGMPDGIRTIRRYEAGQDIPGPVRLLCQYIKRYGVLR